MDGQSNISLHAQRMIEVFGTEAPNVLLFAIILPVNVLQLSLQLWVLYPKDDMLLLVWKFMAVFSLIPLAGSVVLDCVMSFIEDPETLISGFVALCAMTTLLALSHYLRIPWNIVSERSHPCILWTLVAATVLIVCLEVAGSILLILNGMNYARIVLCLGGCIAYFCVSLAFFRAGDPGRGWFHFVANLPFIGGAFLLILVPRIGWFLVGRVFMTCASQFLWIFWPNPPTLIEFLRSFTSQKRQGDILLIEIPGSAEHLPTSP